MGHLEGEGGRTGPVSWREAGKHLEVCEQIMRLRPRWLVFWGPVTRFYWACPLFWTPDWLWAVCGADPYALVARMDEVERVFLEGKDGERE